MPKHGTPNTVMYNYNCGRSSLLALLDAPVTAMTNGMRWSVPLSQSTATMRRPLQPDTLGDLAHRLPHAQITQDLLGTSQDRIKLLRALELLDKFAHTVTSVNCPCPFDRHWTATDADSDTYPVLVRPRPPKMLTASSAISPAKRVDCILRNAICPARLRDCSLYVCTVSHDSPI